MQRQVLVIGEKKITKINSSSSTNKNVSIKISSDSVAIALSSQRLLHLPIGVIWEKWSLLSMLSGRTKKTAGDREESTILSYSLLEWGLPTLPPALLFPFLPLPPLSIPHPYLPSPWKQHRWGGEKQRIQTDTLRGHKQVRGKHLCMVRKIPLLSWTISEVTETMETNINVASALHILSLKQ